MCPNLIKNKTTQCSALNLVPVKLAVCRLCYAQIWLLLIYKIATQNQGILHLFNLRYDTLSLLTPAFKEKNSIQNLHHQGLLPYPLL